MNDKPRPTAFVIMPFERASTAREDSRWQQKILNKENLDTIFEMIRSSLEPEYSVSRSVGPGNIVQQIILNLHRADLVVADLTGLNPNVMYELGVRHSFSGKKTLLLSQDLRELPFDLSGFYCVQYKWINSTDKECFRRDVREQLLLIDSSEHAVYGPVESYLEIRNYSVTLYESKVAMRRLVALCKEIHSQTAAHCGALGILCQRCGYDLVGDANWYNFDVEALRAVATQEHREAISKAMIDNAFLVASLSLMMVEDYIPDAHLSKEERTALLLMANTFRLSMVYSTRDPIQRLVEISSGGVVLSRDFAVILARMEGDSQAFRETLYSTEVKPEDIYQSRYASIPKVLFDDYNRRGSEKRQDS